MIGRTARGLACLGALVALLAGVPWALARLVGRPWPSSVPDAHTFWTALKSGDVSDTTVIKALALVVWIAWLRLAISVLVEVGARVVGREAPSVPGLGSFQRWAATLIAGIVILVGGAPRTVLAAADHGPRPIATALLNTSVDRWVPTGDASPEGGPAGSTATTPPTSTDQYDAHVVERNESFWSIAERFLGDGVRWRELLDINRGHEVAPGVVFDGSPNRLLPGWTILVPGPAAEGSALVPAAGEPAGSTVVVQPGDTLSEIAADVFGDATAWPPLWEANRGREFNGRLFDDPNLIIPGWELVIPEVVSPPAAPPAETQRTSPPPLSAVAPPPELLPPPPAAPLPVPAAPTPAFERLALASIGTADLDTRGTLPAPPEIVPAAPAAAPAPAGWPAPATAPAAAVPTADGGVVVPLPALDVSPPVPSQQPALPAGLGAAVLVSSGVLGSVMHRRRRLLRAAGVNARLVEPSAGGAATETLLRRLGDGDRIVRLEVALRAAACRLVATSPGVTVLGAVLDCMGRLDLLLSGAACDASEPWHQVGDHRWRLPAEVDLADLASDARSAGQPCPAMVHLGTTPIDVATERADLFVDLEAIGLLTVTAEPGHAEQVVRALAAGLAVSPLAETAHVVTLGLDVAGLSPRDVIGAESLDAALDAAAAAIGTTASMTSATLATFTLRARQHGGEAWEPAIVLATGTTADDRVDTDLVHLTRHGGRGLAVVIDRHIDGATWRLEQQLHGWMLHPLGIEVTPVGISSHDVGSLRVVLDEADRCVEDDPVGAEPEVGVLTSSLSAEFPLMVRLLGPVDVVDMAGQRAVFDRAKSLELVVWLSLHREHSTRTAARTALWEASVRDATFANVVSDARRSLSRLVAPPDGEEWIARTMTEQLPLHGSVVTDVDVLRAHLGHARARPAGDAIAVLRPGLELVRDAAFAATSYLWPDSEGISSQCTLLVTSAAAVLAGLYLAEGDTDGVFWATGQGLKALAGHEELIALRMRAYAQQGDLSGVRHEWESYQRILHADVWSDGEPAPKLVSLRRQLLAGSRAAS